MKYWEIIADKLSAAGWSWGMTTTSDAQERGQQFIRPHDKTPAIVTVRVHNKQGHTQEVERYCATLSVSTSMSSSLVAPFHLHHSISSG